MKISAFLALALVFFAAVPSFADQCLSRVSDSALLAEVGFRLAGGGSSPTRPGQVDISVTCGGSAEVIITTTNLQNGQTASQKISTGNWITCREKSEKLHQKLRGPNGVGRIFAFCGGSAEVMKYLVLPTGEIKQTEKISTGNWITCNETADRINGEISVLTHD